MIGKLRGTIESIRPDCAILDVGGVGYVVRIALSTYYELEPLGTGNEASVLVHTHVRDDALELFGFWTEREKLLFERLISVSGIGPRLAQVVLSGMPPEDLLRALAAGDLARLTRIPGVGKKTAERMVLELRDAARELTADDETDTGGRERSSSAPQTAQDVVAALLNLGYREKEAERAVDTIVDEAGPDLPFQELLRRTLRSLSRA